MIANAVTQKISSLVIPANVTNLTI